MSIFALVIDRNFFVMGEPAVYTPDGGPSKSIKVMPRRPDEVIGFGDTSIASNTAIFDIRVADIANPQEGDTLLFKEITYVVQGSPTYQDGDRLIWRVNTYPQENP